MLRSRTPRNIARCSIKCAGSIMKTFTAPNTNPARLGVPGARGRTTNRVVLESIASTTKETEFSRTRLCCGITFSTRHPPSSLKFHERGPDRTRRRANRHGVIDLVQRTNRQHGRGVRQCENTHPPRRPMSAGCSKQSVPSALTTSTSASMQRCWRSRATTTMTRRSRRRSD